MPYSLRRSRLDVVAVAGLATGMVKMVFHPQIWDFLRTRSRKNCRLAGSAKSNGLALKGSVDPLKYFAPQKRLTQGTRWWQCWPMPEQEQIQAVPVVLLVGPQRQQQQQRLARSELQLEVGLERLG
jgi:hypothetical protein